MPADNEHATRLYAARVEAFLAHRFGQAIGDLTPIAHGEWSKAFSFHLAERGAEYVARFSALQDDFLKDRLAMDYAAADLPIPKILEVGEALDGFYAISERAHGNFLDALDGDAVRRLLPSLLGALDAARRVDLSTEQGYGLWGADGIGQHPTWRAALLDVASDVPTRRTAGWRARLASSPTGCGPFDEGFGYLQSLVDACPEERHLVHSDLLNYNVLVSGDRISAVLDWGSSVYGDFVFDVAWLSFWRPWYPAWADIDFAFEAAQHYASMGLEVPRFAERMRCYEVAIGLEHIAYNAFKGRWKELEAVAERTLLIAKR
jgi:hygromycin-B 4-O-kinase